MPRDVRSDLDALYKKYNRRERPHPDPVDFLYDYKNPLDLEVAALVASSLAFGRVEQIMRSVEAVLDEMGESPASFILDSTSSNLKKIFPGFKHRWIKCGDVASLLAGAASIIRKHGSLRNCFCSALEDDHNTIIPALTEFAAELDMACNGARKGLLPSPARGSACKRLNLFLRWMVRRDRVDPGGWDEVPASKLVIPLDTHMHRICREMGFTARKSADLCAVLEITRCFRDICPEDPVRYDFAIAHMGMDGGRGLEKWLADMRSYYRERT